MSKEYSDYILDGMLNILNKKAKELGYTVILKNKYWQLIKDGVSIYKTQQFDAMCCHMDWDQLTKDF